MHTRFLRLALIWLSLGLSGLCSTRADGWRETAPGVFEGEAAGWRFVVSAERARLVWAGPVGADNVLIAGGHRAWLAPQLEWPEFWPPPRDWEGAAAASLRVDENDANRLLLTHSRKDERFPGLARHYTLRQEGLAMTLLWREAADAPSGRYQALQILQLRTDAEVTVRPRATPEAPLGHGLLALSSRPEVLAEAPLPPGFSRKGRGAARVFVFNGREEKFGFAPQPIRVRMARDGSQFSMDPPEWRGLVAEGPVPEFGLTTQIYHGADGWPMMEVEQLTPRLRASEQREEIAVTVLLRAGPPQALRRPRRGMRRRKMARPLLRRRKTPHGKV